MTEDTASGRTMEIYRQVVVTFDLQIRHEIPVDFREPDDSDGRLFASLTQVSDAIAACPSVVTVRTRAVETD